MRPNSLSAFPSAATLAVVLCLCSSAPTRAADPAPPEIAGDWAIKAPAKAEAEESPVSGLMRIERKGVNYRLYWVTKAGDKWFGCGIPYNNKLAACWTSQGSVGLTLYRIESGGTLRGEWTQVGKDSGTGTEVATPDEVRGVAGTYSVTGHNPGSGSKYSGKLAVKKLDDIYHLAWKVGKVTYHGVGLRDGDRLTVGWTSGDHYGAAIYTFDGKEAASEWVGASSTKIGHEKLEKTK